MYRNFSPASTLVDLILILIPILAFSGMTADFGWSFDKERNTCRSVALYEGMTLNDPGRVNIAGFKVHSFGQVVLQVVLGCGESPINRSDY